MFVMMRAPSTLSVMMVMFVTVEGLAALGVTEFLVRNLHRTFVTNCVMRLN